jgi:hypothetical protein
MVKKSSHSVGASKLETANLANMQSYILLTIVRVHHAT